MQGVSVRPARISTQVWLLVGVFFLVTIASSVFEAHERHDALLAEKKLKTRHVVEAAWSVLWAYYRLQLSGAWPEERAKKEAIRTVSLMRYDQTEYFWINDLTRPVPRMLMHPTAPTLEGTILDDTKFNRATSQQAGASGPVLAIPGKNLFVAFADVVNEAGEGYVVYDWPKPLAGGGTTSDMFPKMSYVKGFDPWGWVIGSGIYIDDVEQAFGSAIRGYALISVIALGLVGLISWRLARHIELRERGASEARIRFLAHYDTVTRLPNAVLFRDRVERALAQCARAGTNLALICLDIDHFKAVNDSLGYQHGNELLRQVGERLKTCVRISDTMCRQGGDEFLLLVPLASDPGAGSVVADKVLRVLRQPMEIGGYSVTVGASMGLSVFPNDGEDFDTLLQRAELAMYRVKDEGRNGYRFFCTDMNANALERLRMANLLRRALEHQEFLLHYQPQVDLHSGEIIGLEALLRWKSPELGLVAPGRFIPIAEETGLIVPIGAWVLRDACRQNQAWQACGLPKVPVAVNLSALQFARGDLFDTVEQALADSGLAASFLELELTESILIHDVDKILAVLQHLKRLGVKLSIDDFGTGYSSLSYLKRLEVDKLKIDQSFVRDIASDPEDAAIVRAIIQMGRSLKLRTIAEGVETAEQVQFLRAEGCQEAQGYLFSRPLPWTELETVLRLGTPLALSAGPTAKSSPEPFDAC